jgi:anthranilate/para-aminobenzoate synthase component II
MDTTINNLRFEYDEKLKCINTYDSFTNNLVSYIHVQNNEVVDRNSFESVCQRWASSIDNYNNMYQGVDYNSWY